jgi:DnaJ-class molecular chaperone
VRTALWLMWHPVSVQAKAKAKRGVQVVLQRDTVTEPGLVQRVKGEGMPRQGNESSRGDLVVTYSISFPTILSSDQKSKVRKLFG